MISFGFSEICFWLECKKWHSSTLFMPFWQRSELLWTERRIISILILRLYCVRAFVYVYVAQ